MRTTTNRNGCLHFTLGTLRYGTWIDINAIHEEIHNSISKEPHDLSLSSYGRKLGMHVDNIHQNLDEDSKACHSGERPF